MFRHERPQQGRYRQFYQIDVEALGFAGPDIDVELIAMTARLWRTLGITRVQLKLNSLGTPESRRSIARSWSDYFTQHAGCARCRQPAPPRRQSAAHPRQQEPGHAGRGQSVRRC